MSSFLGEDGLIHGKVEKPSFELFYERMKAINKELDKIEQALQWNTK